MQWGQFFRYMVQVCIALLVGSFVLGIALIFILSALVVLGG